MKGVTLLRDLECIIIIFIVTEPIAFVYERRALVRDVTKLAPSRIHKLLPRITAPASDFKNFIAGPVSRRTHKA